MSGNSYRRRLKKSQRKGYVQGWYEAWSAGWKAGHADGYAQGKPFGLPNPTEYASAVKFIQEFQKAEAELNGDPAFVPPYPADWIVCAVIAARQLNRKDTV